MALESTGNFQGLNANWPLDTDPAQLGAAHLRLLKGVLKNYFVGTFADKASFVTWAASNTALSGSLVLINSVWWVVSDVGASTNTTEGKDWFIVTATKQARKLSSLNQLGPINSLNTQGIATITSSQRRRPQVRYSVSLAGTDFDATVANAAFPNGTPVANDVAIQLRAGSPSYSFIRQYTGSMWAEVNVDVYNTLVAFGSLAAQLVIAESVDTVRVRTMREELLGLTHLQVADPDGFGPDSLVFWHGLKAGVMSNTGEVNYSSLLKANAIRWVGLDGSSATGAPPAGAVTPLADLGTLGTAYAAQTVAYTSYSFCNISLILATNGNFSIAANDEVLSGTPIDGPYVDNPGVGAGTTLEARFAVTGDVGFAFSDAALETWQPLTSTRNVGVFVSVTGEVSSAAKTINVTAQVRIVGNPASEVSKVIALTANAHIEIGPAP